MLLRKLVDGLFANPCTLVPEAARLPASAPALPGTQESAFPEPPHPQPAYDEWPEERAAIEASFENLTRLPAAILYAAAAHGLPGEPRVRLDFDGPQSYGAAFRIICTGNSYSDSYTVTPSENAVTQGYLENRRGDRRTGRQLLANRALVGMLTGMREMTLQAGSEMGGYVWPRVGARVQPGCAYNLSNELFERFAVLDPFITNEQSGVLARLCALPGPDALYAIAHMSQPLPDLKDAFDNAMSAGTDYGYETYRACGFFTPLTIGKFMLCGTSYPAYIDFACATQMDLLEEASGTPVRALAASVSLNRPTQSAARSSTPAFQTAPRP